MAVPVRPDSEFGLTVAQIQAMPDRLRKKAASTADPAEKARLEADIPVWEDAAKQLAGKEGKWSITWTKVREAIADADALIEEIGARNSKNDLGRIQAAHDTLVDLGAICSGKVAESADAATYVVQSSGRLEKVLIHESGPGLDMVTLAEAGAEFDDATQTVRITPIRPGPGNKRDHNFYPPETLREAVDAGRFSNVKMFANHPRRSDDKERPERDVNDWVAVVKETTWDGRSGRPRSTVQVLDPAIYEKWKRAPEHIAFSVLGNGRARAGRVNGEDVRVIESIEKVRSIDWVTEAGAGGAIDFAESADEEFDMGLEELKEMSVEQLRAARPDLVIVLAEDDEDEDETADDEADHTGGVQGDETLVVGTETANDTDEGGSGEASNDVPEGAAPEGYVSKAEFDDLKTKFDALSGEHAEAKVKEAVADAKVKAKAVVTGALKETAFPLAARQAIEVRFAEASLGDGMLYADEPALKGVVAAEIAQMKRVLDNATGRSSNVIGMGAVGGDDPAEAPSLRESKEAEIAKRLGGDQMPTPPTGESGIPADQVSVTESAKSTADKIAARLS